MGIDGFELIHSHPHNLTHVFWDSWQGLRVYCGAWNRCYIAFPSLCLYNENRKYRDSVETFFKLIFFHYFFTYFSTDWFDIFVVFWLFICFIEIKLTCIYLMYINWCFDICIPHETFTTIKIVYISIISQIFLMPLCNLLTFPTPPH